jgi:hypothetical protein
VLSLARSCEEGNLARQLGRRGKGNCSLEEGAIYSRKIGGFSERKNCEENGNERSGQESGKKERCVWNLPWHLLVISRIFSYGLA